MAVGATTDHRPEPPSVTRHSDSTSRRRLCNWLAVKLSIGPSWVWLRSTEAYWKRGSSMVFAVAKPIVIPGPTGPHSTGGESKDGESAGTRTVCPRCHARLMATYDEFECLQCGYVDYASPPRYSSNGVKSLISTATRFVVRYVGDFPALADTLTYVQLRRFRNRVIYRVRCPFCHGPMTQSSLSGKRREVREERYKCVDGHRVSLTPDKTGALGWK